MTPVDIALAVIWWIVGLGFAIGALFALIRMVVGPTIIDRMVASDTILTIMICLLGADMVFHGHTNNLPLMLVLALTAFIASVAVARYVSRQGARDAHESVERDDAGRELPADAATGEEPR